MPVECVQDFLTDRHWAIVRNLRLKRALLIVQLKISSIRVQFFEMTETMPGLVCYIQYDNTKL